MDDKEFKKFQRELVADPTKGPVSHGTRDLMGLFGPPPSARRPPAPKGKTPVTPDRKAPSHGR